MSHPLPGDKPAGYLGLIIGAVVLFALLYSIVRMTNAKYAHEGAEKTSAVSAQWVGGRA